MKASSQNSNLKSLHLACYLLAGGLFTSSGWSADPPDAVAHPAHLVGTVQIHNTDPEIVARLSGGVALFSGSSAEPALNFEARREITGLSFFPFDLTVEAAQSGEPGYTYSIRVNLLAGQQYSLPVQTSPPLNAGHSVPMSFDDCPGVLDIRFVDRPGGSPISVNGASYYVRDAGSGTAHAIVYNVPGTGYKLLAHSGTALNLDVTYNRGADPTLDRLSYYAQINISTPLTCNEVRLVEILVPPDRSLGHIVGQVEMLGETVVPQDGPAYARNTIMVADPPPTGDDFTATDRYTFLSGTPSSGPFVLTNLIPSEAFVPTFGTGAYRVWGRMQFRTGRAGNFFRIPSLVAADRPNVPAGGTVDLGDTFVMQPGFINGQVVLQGPPERPGFRSPLRHIRRVSDGGTAAWTMALHSSVEARGVSPSASEGVGLTEFDGDFDGVSTLTGNYALVLAGLNREPSVWNQSRLNLSFDSRGSSDPYIVGKLLITDRRPSDVLVNPEEHTTKDSKYCFSEVTLRFRAPAGTKFFQPAVTVDGSFTGLDAWGAAADYRVQTGPGAVLGTAVNVPFLGEPKIAEAATNEGSVRMFIPRGSYTFTPSIKVVAADGSVTDVTLPRITNYTNGCAEISDPLPCLMVQLAELPPCVSRPAVRIEGIVTSCTNVTRLVWDRGDNIEHVICENCGANPTFAFDLPVDGPCSDQTFTVTAYDAAGQTTSITKTIPADRIPPVVQCPTRIVNECAGPNGALVSYVASALDDCGIAGFECTPTSGSWFPIGNTTVQCVARDQCGNETRSSFIVTVTTTCPPCLDLQCPQDIVRYTCNSNTVPVDYSFLATNRCHPADLVSSCYPPSGSSFGLGTAIVDCWAFGDGQTNHCSFKVTVLPDPDCQQDCLEIHCPEDLVKSVCGTNALRIDYAVTATNHCNPTNLSVVCEPPSGSVFHLGTTTVTCTATGSGQTRKCTFTVTLLSDCPPVACSTNLLVNGSFENPGVPDGYVALPGGDSVIHGWSTMLNGVEYYNPVAAPGNVNTGFAADGVYLLDLAPAQGIGGGIRQTFATVVGKIYRVSFAMGTSKERGRTGTASLSVNVAGTAHAFNASTDQAGIQWMRKEFNFEATSTSSTLVFSTLDDPSVSFVNLDDVRVSDCCDGSGLKIMPTITVEWDCGILQSASDVIGPYSDVPGATSPHTEPMTGPRKFWRTRN